MTPILVLIGMITIVALVMAWKQRHSGPREFETTLTPPPPPHSRQAGDPDDAYRIGFGTGMLGGSIEDAVIAQNVLRSVEQKNGEKADTRTLGIALGLRNPPNSHHG